MRKTQKGSEQSDSHIKAYKNSITNQKDIHHISWKNHGIKEYVEHAFQKYLKIQERVK